MLSIDITDRQIKLVRGVHAGNKIKIQDADMRELGLGMVSNGYITDVPMVAAELNNIIKSKDIKEKECIVSITSSAIVYKEVTIAKPKNMKNPAIIEAMIQSTMNINTDYNISFTIAGETEDEEKNKMLKVMAAACPQRLVDGYVRLFSQIGLQLKAVNIANNSITRLITNTPKMGDRMPMLLIQIDKNFINMNLYENNQLAFSRFSTIDPSQYETDDGSEPTNYVSQAVYDNLFGMMNFIRGRKNSRPLQEILFYGDIDSFIEITNAISSFNVPTNMLTMPNSIVTSPSAQFDFSKFANAIGALYGRNKELEHINLLEATSAKESKGSGKFGLALLGGAVLAAAVVGAAAGITGIINTSLNSKIESFTAKIQDPQMQKDLKTVDDRDAMLSGFNSYNDTVNKTKLLFNYKPKAQSLVYNKLKEPIEDKDFLKDKEELKITKFECTDYEVSATLMGVCKGDPSSIPSRYVDYLINKVKNKYGDAYFVNVTYTGFTKVNTSDLEGYAFVASEWDKVFDTVFTFDLTMQLQMASDEDNTDVSEDLKDIKITTTNTSGTSKTNGTSKTTSNNGTNSEVSK